MREIISEIHQSIADHARVYIFCSSLHIGDPVNINMSEPDVDTNVQLAMCTDRSYPTFGPLGLTSGVAL